MINPPDETLPKPRSKLFCDWCGKGLERRQSRFCSDKCRGNYWNDARRKGDLAIQVSTTEGLEGLIKAFVKFINQNKEAIERIIEQAGKKR